MKCVALTLDSPYFRKEEKRGQATFKEHEVGLFSGA